MIISMIAAMSKQGVIGSDNAIPWHLPADFAWFRKCTLDKPVIMGYKTYQSIGKPLAKRTNIIISRKQDLVIDGAIIVHSPDHALEIAKNILQKQGGDEIMIIGGAAIYQMYLPIADKLYLTHINADIQGDTKFPVNWKQNFTQTSARNYLADEHNKYAMCFAIYERN